MSADKIVNAARDGDLQRLSSLIDISPTLVNEKNDNGETALISALYYGRSDVMKYLLDHGSDINAQDNEGRTALICGILTNPPENIDLLLKRGAIIDIANKSGSNALLLASGCGRKDCVKLLLEAGADVDFQDHSLNTPLIMACLHNHKEVVMLLLQFVACVKLKNMDGKTAADMTTNSEILKLLQDSKLERNNICIAHQRADIQKSDERRNELHRSFDKLQSNTDDTKKEIDQLKAERDILQLQQKRWQEVIHERDAVMSELVTLHEQQTKFKMAQEYLLKWKDEAVRLKSETQSWEKAVRELETANAEKELFDLKRESFLRTSKELHEAREQLENFRKEQLTNEANKTELSGLRIQLSQTYKDRERFEQDQIELAMVRAELQRAKETLTARKESVNQAQRLESNVSSLSMEESLGNGSLLDERVTGVTENKTQLLEDDVDRECIDEHYFRNKLKKWLDCDSKMTACILDLSKMLLTSSSQDRSCLAIVSKVASIWAEEQQLQEETNTELKRLKREERKLFIIARESELNKEKKKNISTCTSSTSIRSENENRFPDMPPDYSTLLMEREKWHDTSRMLETTKNEFYESVRKLSAVKLEMNDMRIENERIKGGERELQVEVERLKEILALGSDVHSLREEVIRLREDQQRAWQLEKEVSLVRSLLVNANQIITELEEKNKELSTAKSTISSMNIEESGENMVTVERVRCLELESQSLRQELSKALQANQQIIKSTTTTTNAVITSIEQNDNKMYSSFEFEELRKELNQLRAMEVIYNELKNEVESLKIEKRLMDSSIKKKTKRMSKGDVDIDAVLTELTVLKTEKQKWSVAMALKEVQWTTSNNDLSMKLAVLQEELARLVSEQEKWADAAAELDQYRKIAADAERSKQKEIGGKVSNKWWNNL